MTKTKKGQKPPGQPGGLGLLTRDFVISAAFVFASSLLGEAADLLVKIVPQLQALGNGVEFGTTLALLLLLIYLFATLQPVAIVNPTSVFSMIIAGKGPAFLNVLRMVAETAGAFAGVSAALQLVPKPYHGKFHSLSGGLKDGLTLQQGFAAEASLGLLMNLLFLYSCDTRNKRLGFWLPLFATAIWCCIGSYFTGPSMNPSIAASWNYHYAAHDLQEHLIVFWAGPFCGAALAGLLHRQIVASRPAGKKKAAQKPKIAAKQAAPADKTQLEPLPQMVAKSGAAADGLHQRKARAAVRTEATAAPAKVAKPVKAHALATVEVSDADDDMDQIQVLAGRGSQQAVKAATTAGKAVAKVPPESSSTKARRKKQAAAEAAAEERDRQDGWVKVPARAGVRKAA